MKIKDFSELITPSEETMAFGFIRTLSPDDQAKSVQGMVATADLCEGVPGDLVACFERIRSLFGYGLFYYEAFTAADDLAWLMFEQALQARFVTFYGGQIPLISKSGEATLRVVDFGEVRDALRKGGEYSKGGWSVKLRSTGDALRVEGGFVGRYGQLQQWARAENLFGGQRNRHLETFQQRFRNQAAHPHRHINTPSSAARTIHDLAEVINQLWGHDTPGGRLYPAPLSRTIRVISWPTKPSNILLAEMSPQALLNRNFEEHSDWVYAAVLAVADGGSLDEFDTRYDITPLPTDLVWGPGSKSDLRVWLSANEGLSDTITYVDRVFAVRQTTDGRTYLPMRPGIALGLQEGHLDGIWYLVRADFPLAAFNHVRHGGGVAMCGGRDPLAGCAVEDLYEGPWNGLRHRLSQLGIEAGPDSPPRVRLPRSHSYPTEVGDD